MKIVATAYVKEKGALKDIGNNADMEVLVNYILWTKAVNSYIHKISFVIMTTNIKMSRAKLDNPRNVL